MGAWSWIRRRARYLQSFYGDESTRRDYVISAYADWGYLNRGSYFV